MWAVPARFFSADRRGDSCKRGIVVGRPRCKRNGNMAQTLHGHTVNATGIWRKRNTGTPQTPCNNAANATQMRRRRRAPTPASILQPTLSSPTNPPYPLLKNNSYNNNKQPQQPPPHPATIAKDHLILPPTHPIKSYTPLSSPKKQLL